MAELVIRKAVEDDILEMAELEKVCFASPWSYESIRHDICENKLSFYLVAELAGKVVGYVGIWNIIDEGNITNVAVSPVYRRQHIASILIDTLIQVTNQAGIKKHSLEVRASNIPAQELYKKFGFVEAGLRKGYYEDNKEDAIIMWRG